MEIGSTEHRNLLIRSIVRTARKILLVGLVLGVVLMLPSVLRENTFSTGLFYAGVGIIVGSLIYTVILSYKKYQRLIKPLKDSA